VHQVWIKLQAKIARHMTRRNNGEKNADYLKKYLKARTTAQMASGGEGLVRATLPRARFNGEWAHNRKYWLPPPMGMAAGKISLVT
jgi:hypothetical protein